MTLPGYENIEGLSRHAEAMIEPFLRGIKQYLINNPVKSPFIEQTFRLSGPEVRALVSHLRCQGEPIGSDSRGYWYATKPEHLNVTIRHIQGRRARLYSVQTALENTQAKLGKRPIISEVKQGDLL